MMQAKIWFDLDNDDFIRYPNMQIGSIARQIRDAILNHTIQEPVDLTGIESDEIDTRYEAFNAPLHDENGNIIGEVKVEKV